jgi:transcriptional regulator with XRE-family HTH domain
MNTLPPPEELHIAVMYRLLGLCQKHDIGISQLAKKADIPLTTIKNILNGASLNPGVNTLNKLCKGFGITLGDFFADEVFAEVDKKNTSKKNKKI